MEGLAFNFQFDVSSNPFIDKSSYFLGKAGKVYPRSDAKLTYVYGRGTAPAVVHCSEITARPF